MWLHKSARGMVSTRGFVSLTRPQPGPHGLQSWGLAKPHVLGPYQPGWCGRSLLPTPRVCLLYEAGTPPESHPLTRVPQAGR